MLQCLITNIFQNKGMFLPIKRLVKDDLMYLSQRSILAPSSEQKYQLWGSFQVGEPS